MIFKQQECAHIWFDSWILCSFTLSILSCYCLLLCFAMSCKPMWCCEQLSVWQKNKSKELNFDGSVFSPSPYVALQLKSLLSPNVVPWYVIWTTLIIQSLKFFYNIKYQWLSKWNTHVNMHLKWIAHALYLSLILFILLWRIKLILIFDWQPTNWKVT